MALQESSPPFVSNYGPSPPRARQLSGISASIWAPQPQPLDSTWPRALDSFSRAFEKEFDSKNRSAVFTETNNLPTIGREDVFGPPRLVQSSFPSRAVAAGAIGEGRKKDSPDLTSSHVEQLLRTLDLNSPPPQRDHHPLSLNSICSSGSPDFSPISNSSSLLTPTDMSPSRPLDLKLNASCDYSNSLPHISHPSLLFEPVSPTNSPHVTLPSQTSQYRPSYPPPLSLNSSTFSFSEPLVGAPSLTSNNAQYVSPLLPARRPDPFRGSVPNWRQTHQAPTPSEWLKPEEGVQSSSVFAIDDPFRSPPSFQQNCAAQGHSNANEPINFLSLLHPSSSPPYHIFVSRIIKSSDQQASIFLQQKLKVADAEERGKIVDAICARGFDMMAHRFGNWAVQRCLEAASTSDERRKIVACMRGRIVDLATNCYGCHVLQKALDCEEDIRLQIVSELLLGDPAATLVNKHASHVWSKIMELTWTTPAPPIFAYVNKSLKGKWAALACHETGSLVVQHAFENLEDSAKDGIVDEILNQGLSTFAEVARSQWGAYCVQHILEHGSEKHRRMTLDHLVVGLLEFASHEQGSKSISKALKEGGKDVLDRIVKRMCEPAKGARRAMIVDLALSATGSQLIASVLPSADKDQRGLLYECIRGHIVTLRGCKTGSKVIWLFDRMRAYYGY